MAKTFRSPDGQRIKLERETKTLKLDSVNNSDYYKGKNHDAFRFTDGEGNTYIYDASLNADMTEYDSKIATDLAFEEGKMVRITGYFVPPSSYSDNYYIYNPRLLSVEEQEVLL